MRLAMPRYTYAQRFVTRMIHIQFIKTVLLATLLYVGNSIVQAEVYKWTDAQGRVHYGDKPQGNNAETINLPTQEPPAAPHVSEDRLEKQRRLLDAYAEERRLKREAEDKARKEKEERKRKCADLKDDLRNQENASGVYRLDKDGKRVFMSTEEREASTAELKKEVTYWCGKS